MSQRHPYPSLEAMLEPAELSRLLGFGVVSVVTRSVEGLPTTTDARFLSVAINGEVVPSLFVKQADPAIDWVALLTHDERRRAVRLWSEGIFARMPDELDPAVIACADWGAGYAVLMPNVEADLVTDSTSMPARHDESILDAMTAMHAAFWDDDRLQDPALGLCSTSSQVRNMSPLRARQVYGDEHGWAAWIHAAWEECLPTLIDPGLARVLYTLVDDPAPIVAALEPYPKTLVHGDIRPVNIAVRGQTRGSAGVVFIDWGRAANTVPAVDLGFYLGFTALERPSSIDDAIETYEVGLSRRLDGRWPAGSWERQREIGLLAGMLQSGPCRAYWGVRVLADDGDHEAAAIERLALQSWEGRLRAVVDTL